MGVMAWIIAFCVAIVFLVLMLNWAGASYDRKHYEEDL